MKLGLEQEIHLSSLYKKCLDHATPQYWRGNSTMHRTVSYWQFILLYSFHFFRFQRFWFFAWAGFLFFLTSTTSLWLISISLFGSWSLLRWSYFSMSFYFPFPFILKYLDLILNTACIGFVTFFLTHVWWLASFPFLSVNACLCMGAWQPIGMASWAVTVPALIWMPCPAALRAGNNREFSIPFCDWDWQESCLLVWLFPKVFFREEL